MDSWLETEKLFLVLQSFAIQNNYVKSGFWGLKNCTLNLGDKEQFDKEQIGVKELFLVTNCQFTS